MSRRRFSNKRLLGVKIIDGALVVDTLIKGLVPDGQVGETMVTHWPAATIPVFTVLPFSVHCCSLKIGNGQRGTVLDLSV